MFEIRSNDRRADAEVCRILGLVPTLADASFSRWRDDELLAGVIYQRFTHTSITMHVCSFEPNWMSRDFLWIAFHYPFGQLGVERVFGFVHEKNEDAILFFLKLGFKIETRIRKVYPDGDQIVLVMDRDACRWLKLKPKYMRPN